MEGAIFPASVNPFTAPSGRRFMEWNTMANGAGDSYAPGEEVTANSDLTLYAIWQPVYAITIHQATGGAVTQDQTEAAEGETVTLTVTPNRGYSFKEWDATPNGLPITGSGGTYTFTMPCEAVLITPVFIDSSVGPGPNPTIYTITFYENYGANHIYCPAKSPAIVAARLL